MVKTQAGCWTAAKRCRACKEHGVGIGAQHRHGIAAVTHLGDTSTAPTSTRALKVISEPPSRG